MSPSLFNSKNFAIFSSAVLHIINDMNVKNIGNPFKNHFPRVKQAIKAVESAHKGFFCLIVRGVVITKI